MKLLPALLAVAFGIVVAAPAHAEPGADEPPTDEHNEEFLADLTQIGISFQDPNQAISAGKAVCGFISRGVSGLQLLNDIRDNNPGLTPADTARFATISAKHYCPRAIEPTE
ncbi:hypothetical protein BST27_25880 [Mycobacterium intermedium]|uniref:DUF732 domain-containing protein n=1 Tax=Mycobacterium intermedium TaxID=28445 RepID=A0A1E3S5N2_MYCIE|nr:DUF732 domain-containing protein [Mycobacterium intermedium]MCV6964599.1 DUF732 domain-containing protein [Mycobacterium intermedium]ODQ97384.1 hypothetical protein BHQ20_26825 [Mycobacterium intermedium]OPE46855.1 hypothetical protein BV508_24360 [Mycobacterium intermedium]ORA96378.1 hypothetical protein BST27_25880 [Mycobacterium intermedium]